MSKLEIGQTVWVKELRTRRGNAEIKTATITKVGRKWFEVANFRRKPFDIETGKQKPTECSDYYFVYFSKEQYEQEQAELKDRAELKLSLDKAYKWPIATVRQVLSLIQNEVK